MDSGALDRWITGGRYSASAIIVYCPDCEEVTHVKTETEYGATDWEPNECKTCGREFTGTEKWEDDEPPEPNYDEWA